MDFISKRSVAVGWVDGNKTAAESKARYFGESTSLAKMGVNEFQTKKNVRLTHQSKPKKVKNRNHKPPSLAAIARILNFGSQPQFRPDGSLTQTIPARPFMDVMRTEYRDYLSKVAQTELNKIINGSGNSASFFSRFGVASKGCLQRAMLQSDRYRPNADSTIKRKGSSRPLIDTGTLINSVDYEVRTNK